jgi:hypothetical protein
VEKALEFSGMLALMVLDKLFLHPYDASLPFLGQQRTLGLSINHIFRTGNQILFVPSLARTIFPFYATEVTKVGSAITPASARHQQST